MRLLPKGTASYSCASLAMLLLALWTQHGGTMARNNFNGMSDSLSPPEEQMSLDQARDYMLSLINRDRKKMNVPPVALDPVATKAAQWHCDEMARGLFNAHFHPDGKKPVQRYNESGGLDYVAENSRGLVPQPPWSAKLSADQRFSRDAIDKEQSVYFDEKPPRDGHRLNILDPQHTHVGIALNMMDCLTPGADTARYLISTQEFLNKYGSFSASTNRLSKGTRYVLTGELDSGMAPYAVDVYREALPEPVSVKVLQRDRQYNHYTNGSEKIASIFPAAGSAATASLRSSGADPPGKLSVTARSFRFECSPAAKWKSGLYYFLVWARKQGASAPVPVSVHAVPLQ